MADPNTPFTAAGCPADRLLVFNCHEAWVYQLRALGRPLDIVDGLPGRYQRTWDTHMRPVPPGARRVTLEQALAHPEPYAAIITHNVPDLLDVRNRPEPRILMLHVSLPARLAEEPTTVDPDRYRELLHRYVAHTATTVVAVTAFKGRTWGFPERVVTAGVDAADYAPHRGHLARGLRVCNFITRRPRFTGWELHRAAFANLPVRLVGHNPDLPGAGPSHNWDHLRRLLRDHRFYIHTADPALEDGFNMAVLEAMAAGLPVLGNRHPTSPVEHGVSGFLSDDPATLRAYAERLLDNAELAYRMGQAARRHVLAHFPLHAFRTGMLTAITAAQVTAAARTPVWPGWPAQRPAGDPLVTDTVPAGSV